MVTRKPNQGENKLREIKKTAQQLKAQVRQLRKMLTLAEEEIVRLRDIVQDADVLKTAKKLSRAKRKKLTACNSCGINGIEEHITDFGYRVMVIKECTHCGAFERVFKEK